MNFILRIKGECLYIRSTYWRRLVCVAMGVIIVSAMLTQEGAILGYILLFLSICGAGYGELWSFNREKDSICHSIMFFLPVKKRHYTMSAVQAVCYEDMRHPGKVRKRFFRYDLLFKDASMVTIELRILREETLPICNDLARFMNVPCKPIN